MEDGKTDGRMKLKVLLAWIFVGVPLGLGVAKTIANAMKLFQ